MAKRKKIGIIVDYTIRIPDFVGCYTKCKSEIITGAMSQENNSNSIKSSRDMTERDFWINLHTTASDAYSFYETCLAPKENYGSGFDYTHKKYFFNNEHRLKFLEDWSYNLYGQGAVVNSADVKLINICQSKVCDVILLDKITHARKVPNTMAFLSRSQVYVKGVEFVSKIEDLKEMKDSGEYLDIYDPILDNTKVLTPPLKMGASSEVFIKWLMSIEAKK